MMSASKTIRAYAVSVISLSLWCGLVLMLGSGSLLAAPQLNDRSISDAVEDDLWADPFIAAHWIDIAASDGIVTLSGRVDNILAKQRATRIAETIKGVRAVVNTIEVQPPVARPDAAIRDDVKKALAMNRATDSYAIEVGVDDKVVTLSGTVDSWQARALAAKVASGVKGVTDIKNSLVFQYSDNRSDFDIHQDILQALRWDVLIDHALIGVTVTGGHVTLEGTVGSLAEKQRAILKAYVTSVATVDAGELAVQRWARDPDLKADKYRDLSDADIQEALQDALFYDPRVVSQNITPEVADGVATLRGAVDNLNARRAAAQCARNTVGVRQVKNRIKVRPREAHRDQDLEDRIRQSYTWDPYVDNDAISITIQQGVVDLVGSVDTSIEKAQAENLAARVAGVVAVNNHLVVAGGAAVYPQDPLVEDPFTGSFGLYYEPPLTYHDDMAIKDAIEDELFWSPFVDLDDIQVHVTNGKATLTGTVDSLREYRVAVRNALDGGASIVRNELKVR
jgi:osmotically-inducible protein OsmY